MNGRTHNSAERMRLILQAMERSIDTARFNRTKQHSVAAAPSPVPARPAAPAGPVFPAPLSVEHGPQRLKARPKRTDDSSNSPLQTGQYRSVG